MKLFADRRRAQAGTREKRGLTAALKTRRFDAGSYTVAAAVIVIAIAAAVNVFVGLLPSSYTKLDNTGSGLFTLSQQTESLLAALDTDVDIYWIVQSGSEDASLGTLLERYSALSDKLHVTKKDPDVSPGFAAQYTTGTVYNNDLVVCANGRSRYVSNSDIYEYDYSNYYTNYTYDVSFAGEGAVTSAISYVTSEALPVMYTLTGHGEAALSSSFQAAVEKDNVETRELSLLTAGVVPEDCDILLIYAPQSDLSAQELEEIRTYLHEGGSMILITDPPRGDGLENLYALMGEYGVSASDGIVIEDAQDNYAWGMPYYLLPELNSHSITAPLISAGYYVLLPIAQGLTISDDLPEGMSVESLLDTSASAYSKLDGYSMTSYSKDDGDIDGPFSLAAAITDSSGEEESRIVWVSSSALLDDETNMRVSGGNEDMFLNTIGWMCSHEEGISIRAKSLSTEYLTISSSAAAALSALVTAMIPAAVLAAGICIKVRRQRK